MERAVAMAIDGAAQMDGSLLVAIGLVRSAAATKGLGKETLAMAILAPAVAMRMGW